MMPSDLDQTGDPYGDPSGRRPGEPGTPPPGVGTDPFRPDAPTDPYAFDGSDPYGDLAGASAGADPYRSAPAPAPAMAPAPGPGAPAYDPYGTGSGAAGYSHDPYGSPAVPAPYGTTGAPDHVATAGSYGTSYDPYGSAPVGGAGLPVAAPPASSGAPVAAHHDPYAPSDPYGSTPAPYGSTPDVYAASDPYGSAPVPYGSTPDPYAPSAPTSYGAPGPTGAPYGAGTPGDPYGAPAAPSGFTDAPASTIRVSVAVVEPNAAARDRLMSLLGAGGTPFGSVEELAARLTGSVPVVVILGPSCATPSDLAVTERLIQAHPALGAILVVEELTTTLLQQALRSGVKDVLTFSGEAGQLTQAVQRVAVTLDTAPRRPAPSDVEDVIPGGPDGSGELGQVITVFSTKGGAGKSVISTNLAITLAQRSNQPVCLVDADLQFGDVAVMLKLTPHHTIVDAVASIDRLDSALLESLLVTHEASGLRVMPAPLEPAFADQVGAGEMVAIVEQLRRFCSFVIVDTPAYFNDVVLGLVEISDKVVLVAGMDIPNIKNVKIGLQTLRLLNTPMEKLLLVLNRSNSKVKLDIGEVERTLQVKADALVPSDVLIPQSVNKGVPVVLHAPKSPVAKSIRQLADIFQPAAALPKRK